MFGHDTTRYKSLRPSVNTTTTSSRDLPQTPVTPISTSISVSQHLVSPDLLPEPLVDVHNEAAVLNDNPNLNDPSQHSVHDLMSLSTVAAGPSIQLVERMSAGIRRLEAEKFTTREELLRISRQRDDARTQIVSLMREVEEHKQAAVRVRQLESDVEGINERYLTTLELLGEKSELVEELRADILDVKAMYRELVERTV